jgi:hypothetical protein
MDRGTDRSAARRGAALRVSREDDDSVLIGDHGSAGNNLHSADLDRLVNFAGAGLAAFAWVRTQRLDANLQTIQGDAVADRPVDHQAGPAAVYGDTGDHVTDQRCA